MKLIISFFSMIIIAGLLYAEQPAPDKANDRNMNRKTNSVGIGSASVTNGKDFIFEAEKGQYSPASVTLLQDKSFSNGKALQLKAPVEEWPEPATEVSVSFDFPTRPSGRYVAEIWFRGTPELAAVLKGKPYNKTVNFRLATEVWTGREFSAFRPGIRMNSNITVKTPSFPLDGASRLWLYLPAGVIVDRLALHVEQPPKVPEEAKHYNPPVVPGDRPRVFLNREALDKVREYVKAPENQTAWKMIVKSGNSPVNLPEKIVPNRSINRQLQAKAFLWLLNGKEEYAREAVDGLNHYFNALEFGTQPDVSREIGNALMSAAIVYDWCYDFFTPEERKVLLNKAIELNSEMEVGYPPFKQNCVINGHGNEGQFIVNTLAFAIAFYDEIPELYRYVTYRIMNEIVPAHTFEFAGGWHNQGTMYGPFRWGGEVQMVMMLERLGWKDIYPDSLKKLARSWLYTELPGGLRWDEGDGNSIRPNGLKPHQFPEAEFFTTVWSRDPVLKGSLIRRRVLPTWSWIIPVTALSFNDPTIPAERDLNVLSQGLITGPTYPVMIQRTGWDLSDDSRDMLAFFKGGGYQSGGHQHLDAGHFDIYFREHLIVDLGIYRLWGTAFDTNFSKRASAHNVLTVYDPKEKYIGLRNDGGQQYSDQVTRPSPRTLEELLAYTKNGRTIAAYSGADALKPEGGFLKSDLKLAYHEKIQRYSRSSIFLRTDHAEQPGVVVIYDRVEKREQGLQSSFQLNSLASAEYDGNGLFRINGEKAQLRCDLLLPKADNLLFTQKRGENLFDVCGYIYKPDTTGYPQEQGTRSIFSTKNPSTEDEYVAVLQPAEKSCQVDAPIYRSYATHFEIVVGKRQLVLSREYELTGNGIEIQIDPEVEGVLLAGFEPGFWRCGESEFEIKAGEHAIFTKLPIGKNKLTKR